MSLRLYRAKLGGRLSAPPSKSYAHRAIIAAALADDQSQIDNVGSSDDILATIAGLTALGANISRCQRRLIVKPAPLQSPTAPLDCRDSASTLRFLLPLALYVPGGCQFSGSASLARRPLDDYINLFKRQQCKIQYDGKLPIRLAGQPLAGKIQIGAAVSSQFISGLLLAAPLSRHELIIELTTALESSDYVAMTIDVLKQFGIAVNRLATGWQVPAGQRYRASNYRVEGDYSNAAYWLVAGTLGRPLVVEDLVCNSLQGDRRIVDIIRQMGGDISRIDCGYSVRPAETHGIAIDVSQIVDLVPAIAALASVSRGRTTLYGGRRLRYKESDRIRSVVSQLTALGATVAETDDGMIIDGKAQLAGGVVDSCGDHRIAMMAAICATVCRQPVTLKRPTAAEKSYPQFFRDFAALGGKYEQYNW